MLELSKLPEPMTFVLWHNRLFFAGVASSFSQTKKVLWVDKWKQGWGLVGTFYNWGILAIRGSNNVPGFQAARELIQVVRDGHDIGVTPDGSRPKYRAKSGDIHC